MVITEREILDTADTYDIFSNYIEHDTDDKIGVDFYTILANRDRGVIEDLQIFLLWKGNAETAPEDTLLLEVSDETFEYHLELEEHIYDHIDYLQGR